MTSHASTSDTLAFYRAALAGLLALEHHNPTARRFGAEADAAWSMFGGHLDAADRIDLLLRDAAVRHPAAFGPRVVFGFENLPDDEPFGPAWRSPYGSDSGRRAWREAEAQGEAPLESLWQQALDAWDIAPADLDLPRLDTASTIAVIGTAAIATLVAHFRHASDLDWSRQVTAVAAEPAGRQLAGLAPVFAGQSNPARVILLTDASLDEAKALIVGKDHVLTDSAATPLEIRLTS